MLRILETLIIKIINGNNTANYFDRNRQKVIKTVRLRYKRISLKTFQILEIIFLKFHNLDELKFCF